jgi:putative membrane protein
VTGAAGRIIDFGTVEVKSSGYEKFLAATQLPSYFADACRGQNRPLRAAKGLLDSRLAAVVATGRRPFPQAPMSKSFIVRLLINAAALWVATRIVPGVTYSGGWFAFFGVALIFGIVNTFVGFTTKLLTFPLIIFTLGLFIFVINGLMLWLTSAVSRAVGLGFSVAGFWPAFWGALVVTIVSVMLRVIVRPPRVVVRRSV